MTGAVAWYGAGGPCQVLLPGLSLRADRQRDLCRDIPKSPRGMDVGRPCPVRLAGRSIRADPQSDWCRDNPKRPRRLGVQSSPPRDLCERQGAERSRYTQPDGVEHDNAVHAARPGNLMQQCQVPPGIWKARGLYSPGHPRPKLCPCREHMHASTHLDYLGRICVLARTRCDHMRTSTHLDQPGCLCLRARMHHSKQHQDRWLKGETL